MRTTLHGRGCGVRLESYSPGPYDLEGSCPWPGPWARVIWRPPTYVGSRDHDSDGHCGSALSFSAGGMESAGLDDADHSDRPAQADDQPRPNCASGVRARATRCRRPSGRRRREAIAARPFPLAIPPGVDRVGLLAAEERDQSAAAVAQARRRRRAAGAAGGRRPRQAAGHARLCVRRSRSNAGVWGIREPKPDAPEVDPDILIVPLLPSTAAAIASATAPATTT